MRFEALRVVHRTKPFDRRTAKGGGKNSPKVVGLVVSYRGTIKNGVVVLEANANLPEGTAVRVEPDLPAETRASHAPESEEDAVFRIGELAKPTGVSDLAINIDHYLYGHPKVRNGQ